MGVEQNQQDFSAGGSNVSSILINWFVKFIAIPITGTIAILNIVRANDFSNKGILKLALNSFLIMVWISVFFRFILPLIRG